MNFLFSGFLQEFLQICKINKITITSITDKRTKFKHRELINTNLEYFFPDFNYIGHQLKALKALLRTNIGIVEAPTSSGKTELMIAYIKAVKLPALVLVNKVSLCLQITKRMIDNGIDAGWCNGKGIKMGDVMVSTIGSVGKLPDLPRYKILMVDEIHRAQAKQFQTFLKNTSYPIRFGFSATPNAGDKYKWALIRQYMGAVICITEAEELIENEVIALPKITMVKSVCVPTLDWPSANQKNIMYNNSRNKQIKELVEKYDTQTLILVRNIEHGKILREEIEGSIFLSGADDAFKREEVISDFEEHEVKVIISTGIFNEGISINAIRLLVIAGGGKSKIETVQRLGRGLRLDPKTGKTKVHVFDFTDEGNRFTERHASIRRNIYKKAGFEVMG